MVAEALPGGGSGGPPKYTGWWFDLHRLRQSEGLGDPSFIASYFTGTQISYVGATAPRLGVFVVDTNGAPRVVVGPVARAYEHHGPVGRRLDDAAGRALAEKDRAAPWEASYTIAAPKPPTFGVTIDCCSVTIATTSTLGAVTIEPFDHHRVPNGPKVTRNVKGTTKIAFKPRALDAEVGGVHVQIGRFHAWVSGGESFGGWKFPESEVTPLGEGLGGD